MLKIEIIGNAEAVAAAKEQVSGLSQTDVRQYRHRGIGGEAGIFGLLATIYPLVIPELFNFLKPLIHKDRDLKISFDGIEVFVKDVTEADQVLELLKSRGILPEKG